MGLRSHGSECCPVRSGPPCPYAYFPWTPALEAAMRVRADCVVPGTAWALTGQVRRRRVVTGCRVAGVSRPLTPPGLTAPLSPVVGFFSFGSSGEALWEIQNESDSSLPFLPNSLLSKPLSLCLSPAPSLCPSAPLSALSPVSVTPSADLCAFLAPCCPPNSLLCLIILIIVSL